jgi:hypothetical protein
LIFLIFSKIVPELQGEPEAIIKEKVQFVLKSQNVSVIYSLVLKTFRCKLHLSWKIVVYVSMPLRDSQAPICTTINVTIELINFIANGLSRKWVMTD